MHAEAQTEQQPSPLPQYAWTRSWYPIVPAGYLYKDKPTPFQLLGLSLVVYWHPVENAWRCLADACSHRLAPLSEGYIQPENGNLMCSYHGWEFDGSGACTRVPQIEQGTKADTAARASPRACVRSFPVQEAWNLIWVWPESGADAHLRAASTPPNISEPVRNPPPNGLKYFSSEKAWSMRETPLDYELLVENILDLSHVPFSHHGVAGNRPDAQPLTMTQVGEMSSTGGFTMATSATDKGMESRGFESGLLTFQPPNMVHYDIKQKNGSHLYLTSFTTPCAPGKSRYFSRIYTDNVKAMPQLLGRLLMQVPPWIVHLSSHNIVDADMLLAAGQQRALAERGVDGNYERAFYMPAIADRAVVSFYKWLAAFSGGRIRYANAAAAGDGDALPAVPPALATNPAGSSITREQLMDRFTQHTQHCRFCQEGLQLLNRVLAASAAAAVAAAVAAVASALQASPLAALSATLHLLAARASAILGQQAAVSSTSSAAVGPAMGAVGGWWSIAWSILAVLAALTARKVADTRVKFFKGDITFHDKHIKMPAA